MRVLTSPIFTVLRDDLAAARAVLKKHSMMLLTASKAYVRHPELSAAKANRDYVLRQVCEAVNTISEVAQGNNTAQDNLTTGELAAALDEFDNSVILNPLTFEDRTARPSLEERLESIVSGAALLADSSCTRDDRREKIVAECNAVRQALQVSHQSKYFLLIHLKIPLKVCLSSQYYIFVISQFPNLILSYP